jgi:hypothetical protein
LVFFNACYKNRNATTLTFAAQNFSMFKQPFLLTLIVAALVFLQNNDVVAQKNYSPGYIVNKQGDTLRGYIQFMEWDNNPEKIQFKATPDATESEHSVLTISSFGVANEIYQTAIIQKEASRRSIDALSNSPEYTFVTDTAFIKVLISGSKSLYYLKHANEEPNLYIKQSNRIELLLFKKYTTIINQLTQVAERKDYITQLSDYLPDCASMSNHIESVRYKKSDLIAIFKEYFKCSNNSAAYVQTHEQIKSKFGVLAGAQHTAAIFKSNSVTFDEIENTNFNIPFSFTGAAFADLILPRTLDKWSIYNELAYSAYKLNGSHVTDQQNPAGATYYFYRLQFGYLKMYNMLKYGYPVKQAKINFKAGISNGYMFQPKENYKRKEQRYSTTIVTQSKAIHSLKKYEVGVATSAGVQYKKILAELRYEFSNGAAHVSNVKTNVHRTSLLIGFRFN